MSDPTLLFHNLRLSNLSSEGETDLSNYLQKAYQATSSAQTHLSITPAHNSNAPWVIATQETNNYNGSKNYVACIGHNVADSGGRIDENKGQIMLHMESMWQPDSVTSLQECHLSFTPPGEGAAGVRVMSWNHQSNPDGNVQYAHYWSGDLLQFWRPSDNAPFFRCTYDGLTIGPSSVGGNNFSFEYTGLTSSITSSKPLVLSAGGQSITIGSVIQDQLASTFSFGGLNVLATVFTGLITARANFLFDGGDLYWKVASGDAVQILSIDGSNNVLFRSSLSTGSVYLGLTHASSNGSIYAQTRGQNRFEITPTGVMKITPNGTDLSLEISASGIRTPPIPVSSLPEASSGLAGTRSFVNDANSTTFASVVAGGGGEKVPVYCDGAAWRIGG